jgi:hypothetical protein
MYSVRVQVVRWSDEDLPGWVEVHLRESDGAVATVVDKVPVFDSDGTLVLGSELPVDLDVPCDVLSREVDEGGKRSAVVRLHFDLADLSGRTSFRVDESQLGPIS